ncbi:MAG: CoA transferase [Chloroflexi bacterium]|nr:CoA transferase [Chloroflexota bacterium]
MTRLPLEGIRVVESTYVYAFPYAAGLLSDLGAEVIKVEGTGHIDVTRGGAFAGAYPDNIPGDDSWNRTGGYNQLNRGKKSLTLDLSKPEGRAVLVDLLRVTDVFMENFTPRVMRNWGLDYPNMKKLKPDIIMVSNTGYGHSEGPWASYPAQATTQEATHGHCHITGYAGDIPSKAGQSFVDFLSTWTALLAIANALRYRRKTGNGQWIDVGMYQAGAYLTSESILDYIANGRLGERIGNRHPWRAPQGCYPCAGDDEWCVISVGDDEEWASLGKAMGMPSLAMDRRFATGLLRMKQHDAIDQIIAGWTKSLDKYQVMERLQGAGVPAGLVSDARDTNLSSHYWARGFLERVEFPPHRGVGARALMGRPYRMSKTPLKIQKPGPQLGDANQDVLFNILGYSEEQYTQLFKTGIIGDRPTNPRPMPTMSMDDMVRVGRFKYWDPEYKQKLGI